MSDYSIKSIREDFKSKGIFYTPKALGEYLKTYIDINDYDEVYDPTCGHGNLLSIFPDNIKKYGQEINEIAYNEAIKLKNSCIRLGDTVAVDMFKGQQFKVILANPPFSIKYEITEDIEKDERYSVAPCLAPPSKADYMFILHILAKLKEDGVGIVLSFPGILYRGNKEGLLRKWIVENNYIDKVIGVAPNKFEDTTISTCILVLKKNKTTTDITFINEIEKKGEDNLFLERVVPFDEIKANNFILSPNNYVQEEIVKEIIDPKKLNEDVRNHFLKHLEIALRSDKMACEFSDFGIAYQTKFIRQINDVIKRVNRESKEETRKKYINNQLSIEGV